ncbi:unnamed protein product [Tilletia controversa]|nr:unnamed protein product [Tilletia controversa]
MQAPLYDEGFTIPSASLYSLAAQQDAIAMEQEAERLAVLQHGPNSHGSTRETFFRPYQAGPLHSHQGPSSSHQFLYGPPSGTMQPIPQHAPRAQQAVMQRQHFFPVQMHASALTPSEHSSSPSPAYRGWDRVGGGDLNTPGRFSGSELTLELEADASSSLGAQNPSVRTAYNRPNATHTAASAPHQRQPLRLLSQEQPLLTPSSDVGERPFIITSPPVEESGSRTPSSAEIKQALRSRATTISAPGTPALEAASPRTMRQRIASFASRVGRRSVSSQNSPLLGPSPSVGVGETFSKVQESTTGAITPPTTESTTSLTLEGSSVAPTTPTKAYPPSDDQEPALVNGHSREETEGAKSQIEEEEGHERNDSVNGVANASPSGQGKWSNKNKKRRQKKKNGSSVA